jgi:hypothetical protein
MTGIVAALKANDNIRLLGEDISYFAFALISPVSSYDCFYHNDLPLFYKNK